MVAADAIRTVALQPTPANVEVLGLLVIVRTFLSWAMAVEDGRAAAVASPRLFRLKQPTKRR